MGLDLTYASYLALPCSYLKKDLKIGGLVKGDPSAAVAKQNLAQDLTLAFTPQPIIYTRALRVNTSGGIITTRFFSEQK